MDEQPSDEGRYEHPDREAILDRYEPLMRHVVRVLSVPFVDREDALQGAALGLLEAVLRFDPSRGVSLGAYGRGFIYKEVRRAAGWVGPRQVQAVSLADPTVPGLETPVDEPGFDRVEDEDELAAVRGFVAGLAGRELQLYRRLFVDGVRQVVVAREMGLTPMQLSRLKARFLARARSELQPKLECA